MLLLEKSLAELSFIGNDQKQSRTQAWDKFLSLGLPTRKNEAWKYTNLSALYKKFNIKTVKLTHTNQAEEVISLLNLNTAHHNIVFVDGTLAHVDSTEEFTIQNTLLSKDNILPNKNKQSDSTMILNNSAMLAGVEINIDSSVQVKKPICITYIHSDESTEMLVNYQNSIKLLDGAKATLLENYITHGVQCSAANIKTNIELLEGSSLIYDVIANHSIKTLLVTHAVQADIHKNASFDVFQLSAYSALNRFSFYINLQQEGANFNAKGVYILTDQATSDYHYQVNHLASHTQSNVAMRGVVSEKSSATFNAKAYVAKGLMGIKAHQNNRNIQLSNTAQINTKPELEIYSDDVVCSHGATIGFLDKDALFYLQSRGINVQQATQILIESFAKELIILLDRDEKIILSYLDNFEGHIKSLIL